eukprot:5761722-Lingulodinium_polyedra.AAC.1
MQEATSWKIQQLARKGHCTMSEIIIAVRLMREISWTTTCTEQQHASVSMVRRHHPDYFLPMI